MMRFWRGLRAAFAALVAAAAVCVATPASAERKVALVIGNSAYAHVSRLANPANDAGAIAALLKRAGFELVEVRPDLGIAQLRRALGDFTEQVRGADIAVVFFAGHGIEVDGTNYLIPVDAKLARDFDVEDEAVSLDRVLKVIEPAKRLRLVILDACRDNPFAKTMRRTVAGRSIGRGLARVEPTVSDTLIAFAAKAGSVAEDGAGRNSPFTASLVKHLATPGLDLRIALGMVRDDVLASTARKQEPFVYGSLGGGTVSIAARAAAAVAPAARPAQDDEQAARVWAVIQNSTSPAVIEDFIRQFGATPFGSMARARLEEVKRAQTAVAAPPAPVQAPPVAPRPAALPPPTAATPKAVPQQPAGTAPVDIAALRRALPKDVQLDPEVLRVVTTDQFFANAPAIRMARYGSKISGDSHVHNAETVMTEVGHGLAQMNTVNEYSSSHGDPSGGGWGKGGSYRTKMKTTAIDVGNGFLQLGSHASWETRQAPTKRVETETTKTKLLRFEALSGSLFPVTLANKFSYRYRSTYFNSGPSKSDYLSESNYQAACEVTERRSAEEFHRSLTGGAYIVTCDYMHVITGGLDKTRSEYSGKSHQVFFEQLGIFLSVDPWDMNKVVFDQSKTTHHTLTSFVVR